MNLRRLPGWDEHSYGYHGDDGNVFEWSGRGRRYGPTYGMFVFIYHHHYHYHCHYHNYYNNDYYYNQFGCSSKHHHYIYHIYICIYKVLEIQLVLP